MDIRVTGCIWSEETEVSFGVTVPFSIVPPPYLEFWLVITPSHFSSHYPLGDEAIAGEVDVRKETLLLLSCTHPVDVHIQCLLSQIRRTEETTATGRFCWETEEIIILNSFLPVLFND